MRLRQLGTTQSVVFVAPPEVHQSILDVCAKTRGQWVDSSDVVRWLLEQTCQANERMQSLHVVQGLDFCRRTNAAWENPDYLDNKAHREAYLDAIEHPERLTLEELYGPQSDGPRHDTQEITHPGLGAIAAQLIVQRETADRLLHMHGSAMEEVEQEREVESQVEEVRQVQQPLHFEACKFPRLHPAILHFAKTGELEGSEGYEDGFLALARTNLGQKFDLSFDGPRPFVSAEFMRTVEFNQRHGYDDNFFVSDRLSSPRPPP